MTCGRRQRGAAKHHLIDHELAVVFAKCSGRSAIPRIGRIGAARPLPDNAEGIVKHAACGGDLPFGFARQVLAAPAGKRIGFIVADVAGWQRRIDRTQPRERLSAWRPRLATPPTFRPYGPIASRLRCAEAPSSLSVDPFRSPIGQFALPIRLPDAAVVSRDGFGSGKPGAARGRQRPCQPRLRRPRTPCASSAGGANRVYLEPLALSVAKRIAG